MKPDYFLDQILCDVHVGKKPFKIAAGVLHPVRKTIYHFRMFMRHCFMVLRNFQEKYINRIVCHIWRHNSENFHISFLFLFLILSAFSFYMYFHRVHEKFLNYCFFPPVTTELINLVTYAIIRLSVLFVYYVN